VAPGVHVPAHAPAAQTELQATGALQAPAGLHVSTPLPGPPSEAVEHCVLPGTHWPEQAPATHAEFVQEVMVGPHCPLALHVS
jgi:hypothetical protein